MPLSRQKVSVFVAIFVGIIAVQPASSQTFDVAFTLVKKGTAPVTFTAGVDNATILQNFDPQLPTKFIIHGWLGNVDSEIITKIAEAYLSKGGVNVVKVDWSWYANRLLYPASALATGRAAARVAALLKRLLQAGATTPQKVHLIGFSLGAHVAGGAGSLTAPKVGRITGLDPARPGFESFVTLGAELDKTDATLVDVVHTCAGYFGVSQPVGHLDFFPNGGTPAQPGCQATFTPLTCSHDKAYELYAESVTNPAAFPSVKCVNPNCSDYRIAYMGDPTTLPTNTQDQGSYYLRTNANSPYGQG